MKKLLISIFTIYGIACLTTRQANAQSLTPTVVTSQGDYFSSTGGSVSWTLGEIIDNSDGFYCYCFRLSLK